MKRLLSRFSKAVVECKLHDSQAYPHIKANEYCSDCNMMMCYICGGKHIEANH